MPFVDKYEAHFLSAELVISFALAALVVLALLLTTTPHRIEDWTETYGADVYPVIAIVSGTLLGFVVAGISIIIAFTESKKFRLLKKSVQYETIFKTYLSAMKYLSATTVLAATAIFARAGFAVLILSLLVFTIIASSLRLWRCLWVLREFISIAKDSDE